MLAYKKFNHWWDEVAILWPVSGATAEGARELVGTFCADADLGLLC